MLVCYHRTVEHSG